MSNSSGRIRQVTNSDGTPIESAKLIEEFQAPRIYSSVPQPRDVGACAWSPDGRYFAWSCGHRIVKVVTWNQCKNRTNDETSLNSVRTEPLIIDAGENVQSIAFGSISKKRRGSLQQQQPGVFRYLVLSDIILATGLANGRIRTWDINTGCLKFELCDHTQSITDLSFSSNGLLLLVSASLDGSLKIWNMEDDGNMIKTLWSKSKCVFGCALSPDGKMLASVGDYKSAVLWSMENYSIVHNLVGHQHNISKCSFSPDGTLLATSSFDTRVIVWDVASGSPLHSLYHVRPPPSLIFAGGANGCYVRNVSFSPDGSHVGSVCDDGFVRFWDIDDLDQPVKVAAVDNALSCRFSPDGSILAVGTIQGKALMWHSSVRIPSLQHLCRISIRRSVRPTASVDSLTMIPSVLRRYLKYDLA